MVEQKTAGVTRREIVGLYCAPQAQVNALVTPSARDPHTSYSAFLEAKQRFVDLFWIGLCRAILWPALAACTRKMRDMFDGHHRR